jgi:hypothetical protein
MAGRRYPGLSAYDRDDDASPQARQARARLSRPDNRVPGTRPEDCVLGQYGECWCGGPAGHAWPGKAGGAPHPGEREGRVSRGCPR